MYSRDACLFEEIQQVEKCGDWRRPPAGAVDILFLAHPRKDNLSEDLVSYSAELWCGLWYERSYIFGWLRNIHDGRSAVASSRMKVSGAKVWVLGMCRCSLKRSRAIQRQRLINEQGA